MTPQILLDKVLVLQAGLGRLGSLLALTLLACGFRRLRLVDPQCVDDENLGSLLYVTSADVGRPKVEVFRQFVRPRWPAADIEVFPQRIEDVGADAVLGVSVVVAACNTVSGRCATYRLASAVDVPLVNVGVADGRLAWAAGVLVKEPGASGACPGCVLPFEEVPRGEVLPAPVIACAAGLAATMIVRVLQGAGPAANWWVLDVAAPTLEGVTLQRRSSCSVCGPKESGRLERPGIQSSR